MGLKQQSGKNSNITTTITIATTMTINIATFTIYFVVKTANGKVLKCMLCQMQNGQWDWVPVEPQIPDTIGVRAFSPAEAVQKLFGSTTVTNN